MGWLKLRRDDRDSRERRARLRAVRLGTVSARLGDTISLGHTVVGEDPDEVEARLRNLSHGTNSE
jgi:hypothetical protein